MTGDFVRAWASFVWVGVVVRSALISFFDLVKMSQSVALLTVKMIHWLILDCITYALTILGRGFYEKPTNIT